MQLANFHSHSTFSDGRGMPEDYLRKSIEYGFVSYGFSDHAPIKSEFIGAMTMKQLKAYSLEIDRLKLVYDDKIQVYKGLEVDYIPGLIDIYTKYIEAVGLDYTIGAVHYVEEFPDGRPWGFEGSHENFRAGLDKIFAGNIRKCITRYYELVREMVEQACPDIVAHLDRIKKLNSGDRYFKESAEWYKKEVAKTLEAISKTEAILEANMKGYYAGEISDAYPSKWIFELAFDLDIPVHISSDCHHPDNLNKGFDFAIEMLSQVGYSTYRVLLDNKWQDLPLRKTPIISI